MEKQPPIKNFMSNEILKKIVEDLNNYLNQINLEIDNKYRPATENEMKNRQNIDMGNYFPYKNMTLFIVWKRKLQTVNEEGKSVEKTERYRIGQIAMDQFFTQTDLNLPEIFESGISQFDSKMSNEEIVKKVKAFITRTLLFHMVQEHGENYLEEISRCLNVLRELKKEGKSSIWYEERMEMNARLGQLMDDIKRAEDFGSKTMFDLDKALKILDYISLDNHPL